MLDFGGRVLQQFFSNNFLSITISVLWCNHTNQIHSLLDPSYVYQHYIRFRHDLEMYGTYLLSQSNFAFVVIIVAISVNRPDQLIPEKKQLLNSFLKQQSKGSFLLFYFCVFILFNTIFASNTLFMALKLISQIFRLPYYHKIKNRQV